MYLHLGQDTIIKDSEIIGIFDIDNTTVSKATRDYLAIKEKEGKVVTVSYELPKSFIVALDSNGEEKVYISQISTATLLKRSASGFVLNPK